MLAFLGHASAVKLARTIQADEFEDEEAAPVHHLLRTKNKGDTLDRDFEEDERVNEIKSRIQADGLIHNKDGTL